MNESNNEPKSGLMNKDRGRLHTTNLARFLDERETWIDKPLKYRHHDAHVLFSLQRLR